MSAWKKPSRKTWVKKIVTPSRASFLMSTPASRRRCDLADRHAVHALHDDHVLGAELPHHLGHEHEAEALHVAAQLRRVGGLADQVELVVQVLVELGDDLARLQPLAVGRPALDHSARPGASSSMSSSIAASMPGRSTLTATSRPSLQDREVHLRDRRARHRRGVEAGEDRVERLAERLLDDRARDLGGKRRHPVLQLARARRRCRSAAGRAASTAPGRT